MGNLHHIKHHCRRLVRDCVSSSVLPENLEKAEKRWGINAVSVLLSERQNFHLLNLVSFLTFIHLFWLILTFLDFFRLYLTYFDFPWLFLTQPANNPSPKPKKQPKPRNKKRRRSWSSILATATIIGYWCLGEVWYTKCLRRVVLFQPMSGEKNKPSALWQSRL
jgi:hypothetical protein